MTTTTSGLMVDVYLCVYVFVVFFSKLLETLYSNKTHNLRGGVKVSGENRAELVGRDDEIFGRDRICWFC